MQTLTTKQVAAKLKMPLKVLAKWRDDGVLDGVEYPAYKIRPGGSLVYSENDIETVAKMLPRENYFAEPVVQPELWNRTMIGKYGIGAMLSCAVLGPVTFRMRGNARYLIQCIAPTKKPVQSAREVIGKYKIPIDGVTVIHSQYLFPGVQFSVERVN